MITYTTFGADGVELSVAEWPGSSDRAVLAVHATGFCKEVWSPVASALSEGGVRVVAIDQRGHGGSSPPPATADWWGLGADALAAAATLGPFAVGLGHSSGATAVTMACLDSSSAIESLVVVEPVIFPQGTGYDEGLAIAARSRRSQFASPLDAQEHFAGRGIFAEWTSEALAGYLEGGLRSDGEGVTLACPPELEAAFYELGMSHGVWERLGELTLPVRLLIGANSRYHAGSFARSQAEAFGADLTIVDGTDHFVPMQRPEAVVEAVLAAVA